MCVCLSVPVWGLSMPTWGLCCQLALCQPPPFPAWPVSAVDSLPAGAWIPLAVCAPVLT